MKIMYLYVVASFLSIAFFSAYGQSSYPLVSWWGFDEKNGFTTTDLGNHQTDSIHNIFKNSKSYNGPVRRQGIVGRALVFDGFSNFIKRDAKDFPTPTNSFTITVWVAPRAFEHGDGGKLSAIINQQNKEAKEGFALGIYRHGSWSFQVGNGKEWLDVWDDGHPIPRRQWSFLSATFNRAQGKVCLFLNGARIAQKNFTNSLALSPAIVPLLIGKHNQPEVEGGTLKNSLNMFNGFMDELKIYNTALTPADVAKSYHKYLKPYKNKVPFIPYEEIKIDRAQYKDDPNRPQYHAIPPGAWMNEPHAPFYYNNKYHLTYQHNPTGPYWHQIHWGHWVSNDMVHWYDVPEAIFPDADSVAPDGIWSGSASVDDKGLPVYFYTFGNWSKKHNQGVALAHPANAKDTNLTVWIKDKKPLIEQEEGQGLSGEFRDPFAWKDKEDGKWYLLVGSGIEGKGGTPWIYVSDDFKKWNLKGPFYLSNYQKYPFLGSIWELPVFLPLGHYPNGETKYVMIVSPKGLKQNVEVYYWLGRFDRTTFRFIPDNEEPQYWDYGLRTFIGPSGFIDPKTGRAIIYTITAGGRGPGWSGNASLPTHIFLDSSGNLGVKPIEELQTLRTKQLLSLQNTTLLEANAQLKNIKGDMLEIVLEMESASDKFGIQLRKSPGGEEETKLLYDAVNKKLFADLSKSSLSPMQRHPSLGTDERKNVLNHFDLEGKSFKLHVFIDKSLIQAYANDKKTITTWVYPSRDDSKGLMLWSNNSEAKIKALQVWEMGSIYYPQ